MCILTTAKEMNPHTLLSLDYAHNKYIILTFFLSIPLTVNTHICMNIRILTLQCRIKAR
jgi:hypothetical protein